MFISLIEKNTIANNQGFVAFAKPTMNPMLNGTDYWPYYTYGVVVKTPDSVGQAV